MTKYNSSRQPGESRTSNVYFNNAKFLKWSKNSADSTLGIDFLYLSFFLFFFTFFSASLKKKQHLVLSSCRFIDISTKSVTPILTY